jgi:hypothetical protein
MVLSRRKLFMIGGSALVAVSNNAIQGSQGDTGQGGTVFLTRARFEALVNSGFEVRTASGDRNYLVLASVEDLKIAEPVSEANIAVRAPRPSAAAPRTETFALHFYGSGPKLPQDTYKVTQASLGTFDLFIVPSGNSYLAVFNRLVGRGARA